LSSRSIQAVFSIYKKRSLFFFFLVFNTPEKQQIREFPLLLDFSFFSFLIYLLSIKMLSIARKAAVPATARLVKRSAIAARPLLVTPSQRNYTNNINGNSGAAEKVISSR
jgi:hypothetical protein